MQPLLFHLLPDTATISENMLHIASHSVKKLADCLPMASNYNLVCRPAVILVDKQKVQIMERRETYDDLLSRYQDV